MKKRIALLGNMNNNFFAIVRHLRDEGYDAHMFYRLAQEHFQPKADTFDLEYRQYCHEIQWKNNFSQENLTLIKKDLQGFDLFIGQGDEAALAKFAGVNFSVYYPYGSDFYKFAHLPQEYSLKQRIYAHFFDNRPFKDTKHGTLAKFIKQAITEAKFVFLDYTNELYEKKLLDLNLKGEYKNIPMPFIYSPKNKPMANSGDVHWKSVIDSIRENNEFILLYHGRQEWKKALEYKNNDFTSKNTHHLIEGFGRFVNEHPSKTSKLVMLEYGGDTENSKKLVEDLGITDKVIWMPKMYRKDLAYLIQNVDLCSGEFNLSYLTFGTIIEAMIQGKPVVHYRVDSLYSEKYGELYPLYNAREIQEIHNQINRAFLNPQERLEMGEKAKQWVHTHFIEQPLKELIKAIETEQ
jgi:glycosyltransferase involved in cell wall biosynthesis